MITNIRILESYFPRTTTPNLDYLKDITSIPISLGTQLEKNYSSIEHWKTHRAKVISSMTGYITEVFRIVSKRALKDLCTFFTDAWAFELGFLQTPTGPHPSNPDLIHPVCCPICSHYARTTWPRSAFSLLDRDRRDKPPQREDPIIYAPNIIRDVPEKNNLTVTELHTHLEMKTLDCLAHNIYEVLLPAMYHRPHYMYLPTIRHPCDGRTPMCTPIHLPDTSVFMLDHTRPLYPDLMTNHSI